VDGIAVHDSGKGGDVAVDAAGVIESFVVANDPVDDSTCVVYYFAAKVPCAL